jgi:NhaA family Na+:H+ antiporter
VASLGGIGFTVAMFVTGLAFSDPALADASKAGALGASAIAACLGAALCLTVRRRADRDEDAAGELVAVGG